MKAWFQQLNPREQLLVSIGGALAVLALIISFGVSPLISKTSRGRELIDEKQSLLTEIAQVAQRLGPQRGGAQAIDTPGSQSLVVVVDKTTRQNGLEPYLKRNQPDGNASIRLRFENAPFDTLMEWLGQLQSQYGMATTSANIDKAALPGRVNCNLTLDRVGA
jgi:general secretion pathway protein M